MRRGWVVVAVVALALIVVAPLSVFAQADEHNVAMYFPGIARAPSIVLAGTDSVNDITLYVPDDTVECTPTFNITTTGADSATVTYIISIVVNESPVQIDGGTTTGNLNVIFTPDPLAAGETRTYGVEVSVDVDGQETKLSGKWTVTCPEEEPTATPTNTPEPTKTNTPEPPTNTPEPTKTNTPEPPTKTPEPTKTNTPVPPTATPTNTPEPTPPAGGEGCTPGYWKNHVEDWSDLAYEDFDATFGTDVFNPNITLIGATALKGGGLNALARHAAAAYANSVSDSGVSYNLTTAQVIAAFQSAVGGGDIEGTKDMFEGYNEQGCPL